MPTSEILLYIDESDDELDDFGLGAKSDLKLFKDVEDKAKNHLNCLLTTIERLINDLNCCQMKFASQNMKNLQLIERIKELENALKESAIVGIERDTQLFLLEEQKAELIEKIKQQHQRILSLQNASMMRCKMCQQTKENWKIFVEKIKLFLKDEKNKLGEMNGKLQEVLELLISEMDSQIASLEIFGARSQEQIERLDQLRSNRNKLNQRLKIESESSIALLSDCKKLEDELCMLLTIKEPILDDHD